MSENYPSPEPVNRDPQRRFRISLRTLLLVVTIAALAVVAWRQSLQLNATRLELSLLKESGGVLEITNPDRIHVVALKSWGEELTWRWRIYVPPGRTAELHVCTKDIPYTGFPRSMSSRELSPGGQLVTYRIRKDADGRLQPVGDFVDETHASGRVHQFKDVDLSWLETADGSRDQTVVGLDADPINAWLNSRTLTVDETVPFAILRLRKKEGDARAPITPGFMVWIEDATNK